MALPVDVPYYTDVGKALVAHPSDAIVDFSLAQATLDMLPQALAHSTRPVIGTTGFTPEQVERIGSLCAEHNLGGFLAPNFTIGAVLLTKLAAVAAPYFEYADIVEEHHEMKVDAPSGTALGIAKAVHEAHPERFAHNEPEREPLAGTRGGDYEGISIHAARMPGRMAHHQVTFGGPGQTLSLRHDTTDRECYMPRRPHGRPQGRRPQRPHRGAGQAHGLVALRSFLRRQEPRIPVPLWYHLPSTYAPRRRVR